MIDVRGLTVTVVGHASITTPADPGRGFAGSRASGVFVWEPGDPAAVRVTFSADGSEPVVWTFGRDLLFGPLFPRRGQSPGLQFGHGDVRTWAIGPALYVRLAVRGSAVQVAEFLFPAERLRGFVRETVRRVDVAGESEFRAYVGSIDSAIARILDDAA